MHSWGVEFMAEREKGVTPSSAETVIRFESLEDAVNYLEALRNEYSNLVGRLVRMLEDIRVAKSGIDALLKLASELGGEIRQTGFREGPRVSLAGAELVILPSPDTLERILEEVAEAANRKLTTLTEIAKRMRELAQRNPLAGQVIVEIALVDGIPKYIIVREKAGF